MTATVADVIEVLEAAYPPALAESWDAVGLVCGDPATVVERVVIAVDPVAETVDETLESGAQLLVSHHPLLLRGVHGVPADDHKGNLVHRLIRAGAGLFCAHTNADSADPGVSDALAEALGLTVTGPLAPRAAVQLDLLAVTVPPGDAERLLAALSAAGAGRVGQYSDAAWSVEGTAQFRPLAGADPAVGAVGELVRHPETRLEVVAPRARRTAVLTALHGSHPYQQPSFDLHEIVDVAASTGLGRICELPGTETLAEFTARVAGGLPPTSWGVRSGGDPDRPIRSVAVCGGAGDSQLATVAARGVDAYVTADLRHHPASEALSAGGPALVDVAHWASEWPWCAQAASVISEGLRGTVDVLVSHRRTDPWTLGCPGPGAPAVTGGSPSER